MYRHPAWRENLTESTAGQSTIGIVGLLCFFAGSTAQAWTSASGPLSDAIHQKAIDNVLGPKMSVAASAQMSDSDRNVLKDGQVLVDKDQEPEKSAEHAMTGVTETAPDDAEEKPIYIAQCEQLVRTALLKAIAQRKANNSTLALPALAQAMHALEDSTSPAHRGFQIWSYKFGIWEMAHHVLKERVYPNDSLPDRYQSHLEGSVQYAYDIYTEKQPLPPRFFDPVSGELILPASYLHTY